MTTETKRHGEFVAFEVAIQTIEAMREVVAVVRRKDVDLAKQMVRAASSVAANVAEGNRRTGKDRLHLFRIATGSADEVIAHLRVAQAWGYVEPAQVAQAMKLADRELRLLTGLTR
jgi:four helix bundle protein